MPGMRLRSSRPRPTSIELCAGCGGMSLGLEAAGFSPLLQVERDAQCVRTLALNGYTEEKSVLHADLATVDFAPYRGRVDLVAGGVPCQPFSTSGLSNGANDERNLFEHAVRCVRECAPRAFLFENVAGLLRARFAEYLRGVLARLRALSDDLHVNEGMRAALGEVLSQMAAVASGQLALAKTAREEAHAAVKAHEATALTNPSPTAQAANKAHEVRTRTLLAAELAAQREVFDLEMLLDLIQAQMAEGANPPVVASDGARAMRDLTEALDAITRSLGLGACRATSCVHLKYAL